MTVTEIRSLYDYNRWANARVIEVLNNLGKDKITKHIESSYPSLLQTFAHIVAAEWVWLQRWNGESPTTFPSWSVSAEYDDVRTNLSEIESKREVLLSSLGESDLETFIDYKLLSGAEHRERFADLLIHVVNHSTYHRGQLTTMIRQAGGEPVATDYIAYKRIKKP